MHGIFHVDNSHYTETWVETTTGEKIEIKPTPIGFFEGDVVIVDKVMKLVKSTIRNTKIYGTLMIADKMYGKYKKNKYYYKFIPFDKKLPIFLVPYTLQNEFRKRKINKYACITFTQWTNTHPYGTLVSTIGDVNVPEHTYEYLKESNDVHSIPKRMRETVKKKLQEKSLEEWHVHIIDTYSIENRTSDVVFSIDPEGTKDIDDACSLREMGNGQKRLSIYIANVPLWLDALDIWNELTDNISTIYLPHKNYSMLPEILANNICSLTEKTNRFAFTMDVLLDHTNTIMDIQWKNTYIHIDSNERYDKIERNEYTSILEITRVLNETYTTYLSDGIQDSHDMIQYLMTLMNCEIAKTCISKKFGIYRTMNMIAETPLHTPSCLQSFLRIWNSPGGQYELYSDDVSSLRHECIGTTAYMHITSPIRRIVDIVNMTLYLQYMNVLDSQSFLSKWYTPYQINRINEKAKQIRRVQNESKMIHMMSTSTLFDHVHSGFVINKIEYDTTIQYNIYIPDLNLVHYIEYDKYEWNVQLEVFESYNWKISYVEDEYRIRKRWLLTYIK